METAQAPRLASINMGQFNLDGSMTCTTGQVCHLLGMSEETFRRRLKQGLLVNFPPKLPGVSKYSKPAVTAWIRNNGRVMPAGAVQPNDPGLERVVSDLEAEYTTGGRKVA
jgi:predicted DNA-binding transcriptional regulator AlpA